LKRFCPQRLSFSALVIGAVCPDSSYLFSKYGMDDYAHSPKGGIIYCLPVGMLMLGVFLVARGWLVKFLPDRQRAVFQPLCRRPWGSPLVLVVSLLIGIATHLLWDAFTHNHGWTADHVPFLMDVIFRVGYLDRKYNPPLPSFHVFRVCNLLSFLSTFAGCALLAYEYQRWLSRADPSVGPFSALRAWRNALLVAAFVMPVDALHYVSYNRPVLSIVAVMCLALIAGFVWWVGRPAAAHIKANSPSHGTFPPAGR
jgi:hypothetical protein